MQITDRKKDLIKSGGEWISSIDLENLAQSHPDVAQAGGGPSRDLVWCHPPATLSLGETNWSLAGDDVASHSCRSIRFGSTNAARRAGI